MKHKCCDCNCKKEDLLHIEIEQTVPMHGACAISTITALAEKYRGRKFKIVIQEIECD